MPQKKPIQSKPAAKAAVKAAPAKKAAQQPHLVAKKTPAKVVKPPVLKAVAPKAAPPAKAPPPKSKAPVAAKSVKTAAKPVEKPVASPKQTAKKETAPAAKPEAKSKAKVDTTKLNGAPKGKSAAPPPAPAKKSVEAKAKTGAAEAKPVPKAAPPKLKVVEAKPPKPPKPAKPPKPVKLAPVEAAFAKPQPAKPLAVAAGRAQPVARTLATPIVRTAPRPLSAPKPVAPAEPEAVGELRPVPAFKTKSGAKGMVLVGAVAGAFGVKGEVRLRAVTERKEGVVSYGPLYGEDGKVLFKPKSWRELKDGVAVVTPEVKTREDAEKLKGTKLFVPRANLPTPDEDEFYVVDLLGCRAEALDGKVLGEVCAVWNFGAGDIIEYRPPNGGPNVRVLFSKETAPFVDLPGKRVVLDPPAPEAMEK